MHTSSSSGQGPVGPTNNPTITERIYEPMNGYMVLVGGFILDLVLLGAAISAGSSHAEGLAFLLVLLAILVTVFVACSLFILQPNYAGVMTIFGKYYGTVNRSGLMATNPFAVIKRITTRVANFDTGKIKVNDANGNPIDIGAVIVWRVDRPTAAVLDVMDHAEFIRVQAEAAVRAVASKFPYESTDANAHSLRASQDEVTQHCATQLQERANLAGVRILDCRISHLAYAPEIAQSMLRRQAAQAVVAARHEIVLGAISMTDAVLAHYKGTIDSDRQAVLVNNLMVALVAENGVQPVVNTGTVSP